MACYENYLVGQVFVAIRLKSDVFSRGRLLKQITKETDNLRRSPVPGANDFINENSLLIDDKALRNAGGLIQGFDGSTRVH